jgi:multiple sugar transport system substrate-binding protein
VRVWLCAALLAAAACGKKPEAGGPVVLRYLSAPDATGATREVARRFEAENPGVRVKIIEGPAATNTREDLYASSFMAGEDTYDLAYMDVVWVPKFAAQGWLRPLDGWFSPELQKQFLPGPLEASRYQGKLYSVPLQADGGVLYYRKDLLDAAGLAPPRTWERLVEQAKALQRPPRLHGLVFQGRQYEGLVCCFLELLWGFGGQVIDAEGRVRVAEAPAVAALSALVDAVHGSGIAPQAVLSYQEEEARRAFQEGHAVFMRNWPYAWPLLQARGSPVRGKVGVIAMVHGPGGHSAAALGGWGFGVSAYSRHPEEAWRFVAFNAREDIQRLIYKRAGLLPGRRDLYEKEPELARFAKALEAARPRPVLPNYARVSDALQLHVSAALSLQETPQEALKAAAEEIRVAVAP